MAEINDLNITAANNTGRFPNGMNVTQINDAARELEAIIARDFKDSTGQLATAGTATAYTITTNRVLTGYASGICLKIRFHLACGNAPTLNMNEIGAKNLCRQNGDPIVAGDIVLNQLVTVDYNAALDKWTCVGIGDSTASNGIPTFAKASLPSVTDTRIIIVSDEAGGAVPAFSDGTNWRRVTDRAIVS